jgi:hypothetical protein
MNPIFGMGPVKVPNIPSSNMIQNIPQNIPQNFPQPQINFNKPLPENMPFLPMINPNMIRPPMNPPPQ